METVTAISAGTAQASGMDSRAMPGRDKPAAKARRASATARPATPGRPTTQIVLVVDITARKPEKTPKSQHQSIDIAYINDSKQYLVIKSDCLIRDESKMTDQALTKPQDLNKRQERTAMAYCYQLRRDALAIVVTGKGKPDNLVLHWVQSKLLDALIADPSVPEYAKPHLVNFHALSALKTNEDRRGAKRRAAATEIKPKN